MPRQRKTVQVSAMLQTLYGIELSRKVYEEAKDDLTVGYRLGLDYAIAVLRERLVSEGVKFDDTGAA